MLALPIIRVNGFSILESLEGDIDVFTLQQETYAEQYYPKNYLMELLLKQGFANQIEE